MDKYFLFKQGDVTIDSRITSDSSGGVSVFAIPVSRLAYLSAEKGRVVFVFNDASIYEDNNLTDGESIKKTTVAVPTKDGKEVDVIEDVMGFLSRKSEAGRNVYRFDDFNIITEVKSLPVKRTTGKTSTQTFIGASDSFNPSTSNVIAGVDFFDSANLPIVDYNGNNFTGNPITAWANDASATGGSTYDIATVAGSPAQITTVLKGGQAGARGDGDDVFTLPTALTVSADYTTYAAFHLSTDAHIEGLSPVYMSSNETVGINPYFYDGIKYPRIGKNLITLRHEGRTGSPVKVDTSDVYRFPGQDIDAVDFQNMYVFVVRRDVEYNIHVYNHTGMKIAYIPAKVYNKYSAPLSAEGLTDGDLVIETLLGDSANAALGNNFQGLFARFGVITSDVGDQVASSIAQQLFETYNP